MSLLIVDGYNIINNWPEFSGLRDQNMGGARIKLNEILVAYVPFSWQKIIIVYDAYRIKKHTPTVEEFGGLQVIYTAEGQTADSFIERLVTTLIGAGSSVEVASSDLMEQNIILWKGGQRVSARELRQRLQALRVELFAGNVSATWHAPLDECIPLPVKLVMEKWRRRKTDEC